MVHIRDVWVNWFEGEENGYNVCDFHEWRSDDRIEVLDQAILIFVSEKLFDYIENDLSDLPNDVLEHVHNQSYLRKNMSRIQLDYCFIATDGERIIAVDTMGYKTPIRKSRLTPRQEQIVYDQLKQNMFVQFQLETRIEKEYHILSPHPDELRGLTRKERQLKQLLYMALDQLFSSGTDAEVRYWYTEWAPTDYVRIQMLDRDEAWEQLYIEIRDGWSEKHLNLCEALVKGQAFFEKLWELEQGESVK
ncbi:YjbA family protein [Bacillus suaedae]|uniref:YjbA family protein n=1 Tax=Halalkalibacter suaedae TaxID=2822140 RepID=A0A940WNK2_9BACI|nr:YjbA family protein [Bacillus suaedae]MBP3949531.1 YjbA family protein [Bacillus suaedae]